MSLMTVKQVTKITGMKRETLRYYERVGLLGSPARGLNGYRIYGDDDLLRLDFISKTKRAGFTIRQIKQLLDLKDQGQATGQLGLEIAHDHMARIDRRVESLGKVRSILDRFATRCIEDGLDAPCSLSFHPEPVLFAGEQDPE